MQQALTLTAMILLGQTGPDDDIFFEAKIRPVLIESCFRYRGGTKARNDLRVDSKDALLKGGKRGPALVPGQPEQSLLLQAMQHTDKDMRMPPGKKLPDHVLTDFAAWIKRGAPWPKNDLAKK